MDETLTPEHLHDALKSVWKREIAQTPLLDTRQFHLMRATTPSVKEAHYCLLVELITELEATHPQHARILQERFIERKAASNVAAKLHLATSTIWTQQREALALLAEITLRRERASRREVQARLDSRLPAPTYVELVGADQSLQVVGNLLVEANGDGIVAIDGMGGLGKSSLADALARRLVSQGQFLDVAWTSAQQSRFGYSGHIEVEHTDLLTADALIDEIGLQLLSELFQSPTTTRFQKLDALKERLKQSPHLIVMDNLETLSNVNELLDIIRPWVYPSRFLLTTRNKLDPQPHVRSYSLPPLSEASTIRLVRRLAARQDAASGIATASDDQLLPIFETVGGNPLALRLVVGQSAVKGLDFVLKDLRTARGTKTEELYTYIFRSAWDALDEHARQLWLVMPIIHDQGGSMEMLAASAGMAEEELGSALEQLVERNLVDARGGLEPRYSIHNLTRTFLEEQIAQWD